MSFDESRTPFYTDGQIVKLKSAHVGIAGCGGLGSNVAMALVRAGIENFTIIDFDIVNYSNLNRQFYFNRQVGMSKVDALRENLLEINSSLNIKTINDRVEKENIEEYLGDSEFVVEAFDRAESKAILTTHFLLKDTPYVCVSGVAGFRNCDRIITRPIGKNSWLIGDGVTDVSIAPPLAPAVIVAAGKEADIILEQILK